MLIPGLWFSVGSGTGVSPVCRLHDSYGRDARATTLETPEPAQFRLPQHTPGMSEGNRVSEPALTPCDPSHK